MTATPNSKPSNRMVAHVHPETYQASDPLPWRTPQLHTARAHCTQSHCTFQDLDARGQARYIQEAADLRAELRGASRAEKAIARGKVKIVALPDPTPAVEEEPTPAVKAPRPALRNAERTNEASHPDGAAAVAHGKCEKCGARKGTRCVSKLGAPTDFVHSPRMAAWLAAGGTPANLTPEQWQAHKAARRAAVKAAK